MRKKLLDALGFLRFVLRRWSEDRCPQIAGSLTYTTLLAIAPVFAIAVALLASTPFFGAVMSKIKVFLLLNLAVGGNFGGPIGAETTFPQQFVVDYVRAYEQDGVGAATRA